MRGHTSTGGSMDIKMLSESIGIDADTYRMILNVFYKKTVKDVDIIETAIHEGKTDLVARGIHSIRGSAGNLAINDIYELAKEMEEKVRDNMLEEILPLMLTLHEKLKSVKEVLQ